MSCKKILLCFLILFCLAAAPLHAANTPTLPESWTVREAVYYALDHSPDIRITLERIKGARAAIAAAQSAYYPSLSLSAGYSRTNNPMYSFGNILNQGQFTSDIDFNKPGISDDLNLTTTLLYRFYNGGSDAAALEAARASEEAARFDQAAIHSRLGFEVVQSFYAIVQAEDNVQARQSALQAITLSVQTARARFEAGDLLKADLLNLEVQQSLASENLIRARNGLELARRGFLNLLGLQQGPMEIDTVGQEEQTVPQQPSCEQRPELAGLDALYHSAEAGVRQAEAGYYPSADIFGSYQVDKGFKYDEGSGNSWMAGVKINYTLFNGNRTAAEISRAAARLGELREQHHKLELAFSYEIEQARLALQQAEQRLQVTRKMVEQAVETARLSREQFNEGVLLASDLIAVENRLTDARVHDLVARASRRIAIADLRRAAGLDQFEDIAVVEPPEHSQ